ncbi:ImmA/IrrE family metallo-endopeptidase [Oscillospiraceae bacterium WX1]
MTIAQIAEAVKTIRQKYSETGPYDLCRAMGILLLNEPMGALPGACKGFYLTQSRTQVITVNSDLPEELHRVVLAHELGHSALHRHRAGVKAFHDFTLFDETSACEYEANIFAAELLMADGDVLALLNDDISFFGAAAALGVPPELLDFKFRVLKRRGYKVIDPPIQARGNFLKDIH